MGSTELDRMESEKGKGVEWGGEGRGGDKFVELLGYFTS